MKFLCKLLFLFTSMVKRDTWMQQQTQPFLWLQFHWLLELSCCWGMFHGNICFLETISSYPMKFMWIKLNLDGNTRILQVLHCGIFWRQKVQFLGTIRRPCVYCRLGELAFLRISTSSYSGTNSGFWVCEFNKATMVGSWGIVPRMLLFFGFEIWTVSGISCHASLVRVFLSLQATSPVCIQ